MTRPIALLMPTLCALTLLTLSASPAAAQDASPYSPLTPAEAPLTNGQFSRSPLKLPFPLASVRPVERNGRMDFEHVYDVPIAKVLEYIKPVRDPATKKMKAVQIFDPTVFPLAARSQFFCATQITDPQGGRAAFINSMVGRRFMLDIKAQGQQTIIIYENMVITNKYSGLMPARVGYHPAGVNKTLRYRFN